MAISIESAKSNDKQARQKDRNSSIELLKIVGIFAIVVSHITQTLTPKNGANYAINISHASSNPTVLALSLLRYLGVFGNSIFFFCTAWFLLNSKGSNCKKWLSMIANAWLISIIILAVSIMTSADLNKEMLFKSVFPTTLESNWYLTCYVIFYAIHPFLNLIIRNITQKQHLRIAISLAVTYLGMTALKSDLLFCTKLTIWIAIYFVISYLKLYAPKFIDKKKTNVTLCVIGTVGTVGLLLLTNLAGQHFGFASDKLQHWAINNNPFILMFTFGIFNLVRQKTFTSRAINYIASTSLWIYLIHENIIVRRLFRPAVWVWLYENVKWFYPYPAIALFSIGLFVASLLIGIVYSATINKLVDKIILVIYEPVRKRLAKVEDRVLRIK